ncbi:hypothetical protein NDU88_003017 [Pleurodeles waltl]|uniref:Uncharacterized protein n=1 Tax=Pleurodeles waltl TaxID=8319 RepID=A0AAV7MPZ9_PLEWA|nr:hypothetical protein NDU88_003017 [Pleurodeles waltl]
MCSGASRGPARPSQALRPSRPRREASHAKLLAAHGSTRWPSRGPLLPAPCAHSRTPGLLSCTPTVSTRPSASRGAQEAMRRGHDAINEARAAELAETRPLTAPSWPRPPNIL